MKLTKIQTQKINNFLEGMGVEFIDIRFEMVDHIASEIEEKVTDLPAFFKNRKFQTPFLKYMLSRKREFIESYEKQEKNMFWSTFRLIFNDIKSVLSNIKILLFLLLFVSLSITISNYQLKNMLLFLSASIILVAVLSVIYYFSKFKKYGKMKMVNSYFFLLGIIANLSIQFPNLFLVVKNDRIHPYYLFSYLFFLVLELLICFSFYKNKEKLKEQYQNILA